MLNYGKEQEGGNSYMSKPKVNGKELLRLIRSGMSDIELMKRYSLSARGLERIFAKLVRAGALKPGDLERRSAMVDSVAIDGLEDQFAAKGMISKARIGLDKLKKQILQDDVFTGKQYWPVGINHLMDPFEWFLYRVGKGDRYTKWAIGRAKIIELTPMKLVFSGNNRSERIKEMVESMKRHQAPISICEQTEAKYCEGWIISGITQNHPIEHSWNSLGNHYFDAKLEIARDRMSEPPSPIYILVHEWKHEKAKKALKDVQKKNGDMWLGELGRVSWMNTSTSGNRFPG